MTPPTLTSVLPAGAGGSWLRPYNAVVTAGDRSLLACSLLIVVLVLFYPALFLGQVLAPQAALWSVPPWSELGGPNPSSGEPTNRLAFSLAPRLALVQREGWTVAFWNPFVGAGRVGWLAVGADGYAPLPVLAALSAREPHHFTALAFMSVVLAFSGAFRLARRFFSPWASAVSALAYALSGPVASSLLDVPGTVAAVIPWLLVFSLELPRWRGIAGTAAAVAVLALTGGYGIPWLPVPLALAAFRRQERAAAAASAFGAVALGLALAFPGLFLAFYGGETPGLWWLEGRPVPSAAFRDLVTLGAGPGLGERPWVFMGWPAVLLAAAGLARGSQARPLAAGLLTAGVGAAFLPAGVLPALLASFRPTVALALGLALLAGAGADGILERTPLSWKTVTAGTLGVAVLLRALPAAALWLPWQGLERAKIPRESPALGAPSEDLVLPLVTLFPPDSAVMAGIADVRSRGLAGEPEFRRLLAPGPGGSLHFSRVSDRFLAHLGVRWVLEPQELKLVSGELFSRLVLAESRAVEGRFPVAVPAFATRLGLKTPVPPSLLQLQQGPEKWVLPRDSALAEEAEGWWWWSVPPEVKAGKAVLLLDLETSRKLPRLQLAWDCSGWELYREAGGVRLWQQRWFLPRASWAFDAALEPPRVSEHQGSRMVVEARTPSENTLVLRLKFRPNIQRALLDGRPVPLQAGPFPWSAVLVPAGSHRVEVEVSLPWPVWLLPVSSVLALVGLRKVRP